MKFIFKAKNTASLDMLISILESKKAVGNYSNPYNTLRYRAEKLRRKIKSGKKVASQDMKDIMVSFSRMPESEKVYGLNKAKFILKAKKMPVGTISHGRKKVAEKKWVPVKKEKGKKTEQEQLKNWLGKNNIDYKKHDIGHGWSMYTFYVGTKKAVVNYASAGIMNVKIDGIEYKERTLYSHNQLAKVLNTQLNEQSTEPKKEKKKSTKDIEIRDESFRHYVIIPIKKEDYPGLHHFMNNQSPLRQLNLYWENFEGQNAIKLEYKKGKTSPNLKELKKQLKTKLPNESTWFDFDKIKIIKKLVQVPNWDIDKEEERKIKNIKLREGE